MKRPKARLRRVFDARYMITIMICILMMDIIICQEPRERTHESEPGAGGGKPRTGRGGCGPAVPRERIRRHRRRRNHEGRRPDAWRLLSSVWLEGRARRRSVRAGAVGAGGRLAQARCGR